jgi:hypothetical protein
MFFIEISTETCLLSTLTSLSMFLTISWSSGTALSLINPFNSSGLAEIK